MTRHTMGEGLGKSHNATCGQRIKGSNVTEIRSYDTWLAPYCIIITAGSLANKPYFECNRFNIYI